MYKEYHLPCIHIFNNTDFFHFYFCRLILINACYHYIHTSYLVMTKQNVQQIGMNILSHNVIQLSPCTPKECYLCSNICHISNTMLILSNKSQNIHKQEVTGFQNLLLNFQSVYILRNDFMKMHHFSIKVSIEVPVGKGINFLKPGIEVFQILKFWLFD